MLRLPPSRIEMVQGEPIVQQQEKQRAPRSKAYAQLQGAWRSPPVASSPSNSGYPGRLSIQRGPRRSWEDIVVMSQSENMHRSYSTESLTSSDEDELADASVTGTRLSTDSNSKINIVVNVMPEEDGRAFRKTVISETTPRAKKAGRISISSLPPSASATTKTKHKRRDSVLSENGSEADSSTLPTVKPASSPTLNLDFVLDGHGAPSAHRYIGQNLDQGAGKCNYSAEQRKAETRPQLSQLRRQHSRSFSEPPITTLTRHRPKVTPRHRRYVSLDKHGHQSAKAANDTSCPVQMSKPCSRSLTIDDGRDSLTTSPASTSCPRPFDDRANFAASESGGALLTESPRTSLDAFRPLDQQSQPTLQKPRAIHIEVSESEGSAASLDDRGMKSRRSPISSASSEALRNRRSPLDELARRVSSHIGSPWIASLPVRQRDLASSSPELRFPRFEEPATSPIAASSPSPSVSPDAVLRTPVHRQSHPPLPRRERVSITRDVPSSSPVRQPVLDQEFFEARHTRQFQSLSLPQPQLAQAQRARTSTWVPAQVSDMSPPAMGRYRAQIPLTRDHATSEHRIPRRPLRASQATRRHVPSAEQENEHHMHAYDRERAAYLARQQESSRGGMMNETPPREGRLERRLR